MVWPYRRDNISLQPTASILPLKSKHKFQRYNYFKFSQKVATALLVAGSTLTFGYLGRLRLHPPARIQASFKALCCSYNCRRLTYGSFQLMHMSRDDHAWANHGGQNEYKTLLQRSQPCHKGEFRHVSVSERQLSLRCGQNLRGPFLRATLPMRGGSCARAMADNGETKGLITPSPKWVLHNYYTFVSLHDSDHEGLVRISVALSCELWASGSANCF